VVVIPCGLEIVVMPMHRCSSERKKGALGLFVAVRLMIEGYVQTHYKGACPGGQPKGQDNGGENPPSRTVHSGDCYRTRVSGQGNKGAPSLRCQLLWFVVSCRRSEVLKTGDRSRGPWEPAFGRLHCMPAPAPPSANPTFAALELLSPLTALEGFR
jgi:hypothetical protein